MKAKIWPDRGRRFGTQFWNIRYPDGSKGIALTYARAVEKLDEWKRRLTW